MTPDDELVLVVPPEIHLPEAAAQQLRDRMRDDPALVGAVAAVAPLDPGSCAESAAERQVDRTEPPTPLAVGTTVAGAACVRSTGAVAVLDRALEIRAEGVVADPAALAHDPWTGAEPGRPTATSRPPFPARPVVLLIGCEPDVGLADSARTLANGLCRRGAHAVVAAPELAQGLYLSRPCEVGPEAISTLRPDVVIALDPTALARVPGWCGEARHTTVVELTQDVVHPVTLVPWTLSEDRHGDERVEHPRLRARIGRLARADAVAALINRLCSGPHPLPPIDAEPDRERTPVGIVRDAPSHVSGAHTPIATVGTVSVVGRASPRSTGAAVEAHLRLAGHRVRHDAPDPGQSDPQDASPPDLVVVLSSASPEEATRAVRRWPDRARCLVVEPVHWAAPDDRLVALASAVGCALVPRRRADSPLDAVAEVQHLPPLLAPDLLEDLRTVAGAPSALRRRGVEGRAPVVGWIIDEAEGEVPEYQASVTPALDALLEARDDARLEVVGRSDALPLALRKGERTALLEEVPDPADLADWSLLVWAPNTSRLERSGDVRPLVVAARAGLPTVLCREAAALVPSLVDPRLVVERRRDADAWRAAIGGALALAEDDPDATRRTAAARADALWGQWAGQVALDRALGWVARRHRERDR